MKISLLKPVAVSALLALGAGSAANASAVITDGNVKLGVDDYGQLNVPGAIPDVSGTSPVGVRWLDGTGAEYESTSHGCLCEGWGIAVNGTTSGSANNDDGVFGLTPVSFSSTGSTATSVVQLSGTDIYVTHDFALSSKTDDLYEVSVTIENRGLVDVASTEYRRTMDWDASPTPFDEYVTIGGTATTTQLLSSSDDGFSSADPLDSFSDLAGCGITTDFVACGPYDHGAVFDFGFGPLAAGESTSFSIFYGGAANKTAADAALAAVGAELFSYGWAGGDTDQDGFMDGSGAVAPTYIFAFAGVGGDPVIPPVPVPAAGFLLLGGIGALAGLRKKRTHGKTAAA